MQQFQGEALAEGVGHDLAFGVQDKDVAHVRVVLLCVPQQAVQAVEVVDEQQVCAARGHVTGHGNSFLPELFSVGGDEGGAQLVDDEESGDEDDGEDDAQDLGAHTDPAHVVPHPSPPVRPSFS